MSELVLGTAQWGHAYGHTNVKGRLDPAEVADIAKEAWSLGITYVDTALDYGDAHERLRPFAHRFHVTTKVSGRSDVRDQVDRARTELGAASLWGVLLHDWDVLTMSERICAAEALRDVERNAVASAGVSIYSEEALISAIDVFHRTGVSLDLVQVPANIVDRRLDESAVLLELAEAGACIQVRSVFLQGVLLSPESRNAKHPDIQRFHREASQWSPGASAMDICLGHVKALPWVSQVVFGVTSSRELSEIVRAWSRCRAQLGPSDWGSGDLTLVDPRQWHVGD